MATQSVEFANVSYTLPGGRQLLRDISLTLQPAPPPPSSAAAAPARPRSSASSTPSSYPPPGDVLVGGRDPPHADPIAPPPQHRLRHPGNRPLPAHDRRAQRRHRAGTRRQAHTETCTRAPTKCSHSSASAEGFATRYPWQLSGGQRQRVGLARALAADPAVLLMDEPFGALDPLTRAEMQTMLRELLARVGKTTLIVTHDLDEALYLADRVIFLEAGRSRRRPRLRRSPAPPPTPPSQPTSPPSTAAVTRMSEFLRHHGAEIARLTFEHLWLTLFAMLFAAGIGIPLGILLTRRDASPAPSSPSPTSCRPSPASPSSACCCPFRGSANRRPPRHRRPHRLRAAAHPAQHLRRHPQRRPRTHRRRQRPRHDRHAAPPQSRAPHRRQRHPRRPAHRDRHLRRRRHHRRSHRSRRPRRTHLPRRSLRRQRPRPRRRNPRRAPALCAPTASSASPKSG